MNKFLTVRFRKETKKERKNREKRNRSFIFKKIIVIVFVIAIISILVYYVVFINFFNINYKSQNNPEEKLQTDAFVQQDSLIVINKIDVKNEELKHQATNLLVTDDRFLSTKYILNDSIPGYFGISISEWQHTLNWDSIYLKNQDRKIKFVIIMATEGANSVDKQFYNNWENAQNSDVNTGACHYYIFADDPLQQADNFIKNVELKRGNLYPIVKIGVNYTYSVNLEIISVDLIKNLKIFLIQLEKNYGVKPILFTSYQFYNDYLKDKLSDFNYMFAQYNKTPSHWMLNKDAAVIKLAPFVFVWEFSFNEKLNGIKTTVRMNFIPKEKLDLIVLK